MTVQDIIVNGNHDYEGVGQIKGAVLEQRTDDRSEEGTIWHRTDLDEIRAVVDGAVVTVYPTAAGYSDEQAQDAVGSILVDGTTIDFTYSDGTPSITAEVVNGTITNAKLADMAQSTIKGRAEGAGTGAPTDLSVAQVKAILDYAASEIAFTPASGIAATDVQSAIVEALSDAQAYADALAQGLKVHASVKAVATSALDLSGAETIDVYSTSNGDRILATAQADADENGIWIVAAGSWTRPTDFDAAGDVVEGAYVLVEEGATWEGTGWTLSELAGSFGSLTEQTWTQFSGAGEITAGNALTKSGNALDVAVDGSTIEVSSDALRLKDAGTTNAKLANMAQATIKGRASGAGTGAPTDLTPAQVRAIAVTAGLYKADVGDGVATDFTLTHGYTGDVYSVVVVKNSTGRMEVVPWRQLSSTQLEVNFASPPSSNEYSVRVQVG